MTEVVVARLGRPVGLRGEVSVEVRTDDPGRRFVAGAVFSTDPVGMGPLQLVRAREHGGGLVLSFAGVDDRDAAEEVRGVLLLVDTDADPSDDEPDAWYDHDLIGLSVRLGDGTVVGEVARVDHLPAQDLLVVRRPGRPRVLVPFVTAIVPEVDIEGGTLTLDPPGGLLEEDPPPRAGAAGTRG